jgi:hypothetical protein
LIAPGAVLGIYGNSKAEAIYPVYFADEAKRPLSGANKYELRFAPGQLPPVNAFWSLTIYELPSPSGPFFTVMRLYWPKPEALAHATS